MRYDAEYAPSRVSPDLHPCSICAQEARIKIDIDRTIGQVDPLIFGKTRRTLGPHDLRGGIYDEGNPLSDKDGYRLDVMDAVKTAGVSIAISPRHIYIRLQLDGWNRPQSPASGSHGTGLERSESNRFGTDEFLRYCERIHAEPYICINGGSGHRG